MGLESEGRSRSGSRSSGSVSPNVLSPRERIRKELDLVEEVSDPKRIAENLAEKQLKLRRMNSRSLLEGKGLNEEEIGTGVNLHRISSNESIMSSQSEQERREWGLRSPSTEEAVLHHRPISREKTEGLSNLKILEGLGEAQRHEVRDHLQKHLDENDWTDDDDSVWRRAHYFFAKFIQVAGA